jgi:hypothetical protein
VMYALIRPGPCSAAFSIASAWSSVSDLDGRPLVLPESHTENDVAAYLVTQAAPIESIYKPVINGVTNGVTSCRCRQSVFVNSLDFLELIFGFGLSFTAGPANDALASPVATDCDDGYPALTFIAPGQPAISTAPALRH